MAKKKPAINRTKKAPRPVKVIEEPIEKPQEEEIIINEIEEQIIEEARPSKTLKDVFEKLDEASEILATVKDISPYRKRAITVQINLIKRRNAYIC